MTTLASHVAAGHALTDHVAAFNRGVRTGDWTSTLRGLTVDAEMVFVGVPVGPFHGRDAIGEAYRTQPPDDTMSVLDVVISGPDRIVAGYAWDREPAVRAGELRLDLRDGLIRTLVVTFAEQR